MLAQFYFYADECSLQQKTMSSYHSDIMIAQKNRLLQLIKFFPTAATKSTTFGGDSFAQEFTNETWAEGWNACLAFAVFRCGSSNKISSYGICVEYSSSHGLRGSTFRPSPVRGLANCCQLTETTISKVYDRWPKEERGISQDEKAAWLRQAVLNTKQICYMMVSVSINLSIEIRKGVEICQLFCVSKMTPSLMWAHDKQQSLVIEETFLELFTCKRRP